MEAKSSIFRHQKIIELLNSEGQVSVHELAIQFNVTPETIRRDLSKLESDKLLKKIHGGAVNIQSKFEREFDRRVETAVDEKKKIAENAAKIIKPHDTLFIDFGTTTLAFANQVKHVDHLTVITNSPKIAMVILENMSNEVILIGGQFIRSHYECLGSIALENISHLFADYAVIGAGAIDPTKGVMDQNIDEAAIARKMSEHSGQTMVLADASKWQKQAISQVITWQAVDFLVTNSGEFINDPLLAKSEVNVIF